MASYSKTTLTKEADMCTELSNHCQTVPLSLDYRHDVQCQVGGMLFVKHNSVSVFYITGTGHEVSSSKWFVFHHSCF